MKQMASAIAILALVAILSAEASAGPRRVLVVPRASSGAMFYSGSAPNQGFVQRQFYGGYPYYYQNYYQPYYPPVVVISPYGQSYILPPTVVVNQPYFCVLDNEGFVTRVGLLDHLAGTHKIPLDATTNFCPDGGSCIFPSY